MTSHRAAPCGALHFTVAFSGQGAPGADLGFSEVIFPPFAAVPSDEADSAAASATPAADRHLVLRRGFDGRLDLYRWWDQARRRKSQRGRTVTVRLLDPQTGEPRATWQFSRAQPVLLSYSPLDALHGGVLMETLSLGFERMSLR